MTTIARPAQSSDAHWYDPAEQRAVFEVPRADGSGMRKTTLADARKLGLVPSVTTILKAIAAPSLESWKMEQMALALLTTPRLHVETDDQFAQRVLHDESHHAAEAASAADLGKAIHKAIAARLNNESFDSTLGPYVCPAMEQVVDLGRCVSTERTSFGDEYAGTMDALFQNDCLTVVDWKTCKTMPKDKAWPEHRLQLAAYAMSIGNIGDLRIRTANVYISTATPGQSALIWNHHWQEDFKTFTAVQAVWQYLNNWESLQ